MSKPPPGDRLRDDRALVADDRIVDSGLACVSPHGLEHAAGDEDDVNSGVAYRADRGTRARVQHCVLGDQRPVEVACDRFDALREVGREVQPCGFVRKSTSAFRSFAGSELYDFGMTFFGKPGWTYLFGSTIESWTNVASGCFACLA